MRLVEAPEDGDEITIDEFRAILYKRSSADRATSILSSDSDIADWAEGEGFKIVGYARDNRVDGSLPAMERPGLSAAIQAVTDNKADAVVVQCFDRLARDFSTQDDALRRIWEAGGRFFTQEPKQEWKPDKPGDASWMARRAYAQMAEEEKRALLARLQRGRREKYADQRGYTGGYRLARRYGVELVHIQGVLNYRPIPDEQKVIRRIVAACPDGRGYYRMAKTLNAEKIPTVTGAPWSTKVVRSIALRGPDRPIALPKVPRVIQPLEWVQEARGA